MASSTLGYGVTGALEHDIVRQLAPRLEVAGIHRLWVNDTPDGNALESIAVAASVTTTLRFGTGVISLDRRGPEDVIETVQRLNLASDRLTIGIGASAKPSPLTTVATGMARIKEATGCPVVVGALGPKMRTLGMRAGNGLLLNWLNADAARDAYAVAQQEADSEAKPLVALYVRAAIGPAAHRRFESEAERYAGIPAYAANFERLGIRAIDTGLRIDTGESLRPGLQPFYGALDELVIRAITAEDTLVEYVEILDAIGASKMQI